MSVGLWINRAHGENLYVSYARSVQNAKHTLGQPSGCLCDPMDRNMLAADAEAFDEVFVTTFVLTPEVVQQLTALRDHFQKTTAAVVVFLVGLEVLGQRGDTRGEDGNLYFGRAGVAVLGCVFLHQA